MVVILIALLLLLVATAVLSPWRWPSGLTISARTGTRLRQALDELQDLEAARDAKYREIRDAELDRDTGKLSTEDFAAVDAGLRAEAVVILRDLDRAEARVARLRSAASAEAEAQPDVSGLASTGSTDETVSPDELPSRP